MSSIFPCAVRRRGKIVKLSEYTGRVTVVTNIASNCSLTVSNLAILHELHTKLQDRSVSVLAFPCNQFANQEPLSNEDIQLWGATHGVSFPIFDRVDVKGTSADPLFVMIQHQLGSARWNYTKFVCDRNGVPTKKLSPSCSLGSLESAVLELL